MAPASPHISQRSTQFLRRSQERLLRGLFRRIQNLTHGTQLQSVVMLQFENHALTRRKFLERAVDALTQLAAHEVARRVPPGPSVGNLVENAVLFARSVSGHGSVLFANLLLAKV